jgi:hypothetical protein
MDTISLAAQLIGEEPGLGVVPQTAISNCQTTVFLYDLPMIWSNDFCSEKLFDTFSKLNQFIRIR